MVLYNDEFFFLMRQRQPRSTRTDKLFPYTTRCLSRPEKARMRFTTVLSAQSWPKNATLPCNADCGIAALSGSGPRTAANLLLRQRHRLFPVHGRGAAHVEAVVAGGAQTGRASCRERVCQYVCSQVGRGM